jgi:hypothetical protein
MWDSFQGTSKHFKGFANQLNRETVDVAACGIFSKALQGFANVNRSTSLNVGLFPKHFKGKIRFKALQGFCKRDRGRRRRFHRSDKLSSMANHVAGLPRKYS